MMPIVLDLCCGRGGWAEGFIADGWNVIGIDIKRFVDYPSSVIVRDLIHVRGADYRDAIDAVVASPPCTEFSKWDAPGLFKNLPAPSLDLVNCSFEIARAAGVPIVLENVRGLQKFIGPAAQHYHSFYLWGDGVPPLKPYAPGRAGRPVLKWSHRSASMRARIPFELAYSVATFLRNVVDPSGSSCQFGRGTAQGGSSQIFHGVPPEIPAKETATT